MTAPSPLIMETLADLVFEHSLEYDSTKDTYGVWTAPMGCGCGDWEVDGNADPDWIDAEFAKHVATTLAQALADAGVVDPEQVRKREAAVLHALADKWQWGAWADVLTKAGTGLMDKPQAVLDWLRAQADERGPR